jgi:[ribosomal protein S5]-alanine N-acetyltransferase
VDEWSSWEHDPVSGVAAILCGDFVRLEKFEATHLNERYVAWLNDEEVVRYSEQRHRHHSLDSCSNYWRSMKASNDYFWAIIAPEPDLSHIGNISASIDAPNQVADLAIMIGERAAWGRGYGLDAWRTALDFLLRDGGIRKVTAGTMKENKPMLAVMKRCGMAIEGTRRAQFLLDGREIDLVSVAKFAENLP